MENELVFDVVRDEDGNWCASAVVDDGALLTDAKTLDELMLAVVDLLGLYAEETGNAVPSFSFRFSSPDPLAA